MGAAAIAALSLVCSLAYWASCSVAQEPAGGDQRLHVAVQLAEAGTDLSRLIELGFEPELTLPQLRRTQGWIDAERIDALRTAEGVLEVGRPHYALYARGSAISEGDTALGAASARERFGVDGSGVRVAIISDGVRGLEAAQEHGDAPALSEARAFGSASLERGSEGTAMIELVHDLAPGAELSFGAVATDLDMIAAVNYFAQRVDVIVDDIGFLYPDDQQSDVSRNTSAALAEPGWPLRAYITAAGNWARTHWAGRFASGSDGAAFGLPNPGPLHEWSPGEAINHFHLDRGARVVISLHWNEPWQRAEHDFDLYLLNERGVIVASSTGRQAVEALNPEEIISYTNWGAGTRFGLVVQNWRGAAAALELEVFALRRSGNAAMEALEFATDASSLLAQADAGGGVITVAAIAHDQAGLDRTAQYSSRGPTNNGAVKPDIAAVDGVRISGVTEFGSRFFGTSAAAPHIAAVAALLLEAQPALLAADGGTPLLERRLLRELLLGTAIDIGPAGLDLRSGAGRLDAEAALQAAQRRVARVTSSADSGADTLRAAIERVNAGEADYIAFDEGVEQRVITLESPLPALERNGATLDGAGWRLDASAVDVGLELNGVNATLAGLEVVGAAEAGVRINGANARVLDLRAARNGYGLVAAASRTALDSVVVVGSRSHGVVVRAGSSGQLSGSHIGVERSGAANGNGGAGVLVEAEAGAWIIGASAAPSRAARDAPPPIAPLLLQELHTRSGEQHLLRGILLIDGLPAPRGTRVDLWLDRRAAGSARVDEAGRFEAAVVGPGILIRFSVQSAVIEEHVDFLPGGDSHHLLRLSTGRLPLELEGGNRIAHNPGPALAIVAEADVTLRGNLIWSNTGGWLARGGAEPAAPRITALTFTRGAAELRGLAPMAASVDLYGARGASVPRYLTTAPVVDGDVYIAGLDLGDADRFWLVSHDAAGGALAASRGWSAAARPVITAVSPPIGGYTGGEPITIVGERFRVADQPPQVFIGGSEAPLRSIENGRIVVDAPAANWIGPTDVTVLRSDGRLATLRSAYVYDRLRRVALRGGWNTTVWLGPPTRITAAIAAISHLARRVFVWDAASQEWLAFSPDVPTSLNTLRRLPTGTVLWIYIEGADRVIWPQPLAGG